MSVKLTLLKYGDTVFGENYIFAGGDHEKLYPITFCFYLIETESRKILVDTGCDSGAGFPMSIFCTPTEALECAGVAPCDITDVILTHAHTDHAESSRHFAHACFFVQQDEYRGAKKHIPDEAKVVTFDTEYRIDDEILIKRIGGHSAGSSIVLFEKNGKTIVLCGDECYTDRNLKEKIPTGASRDPQISKSFVEEYSQSKYVTYTCHDPDMHRGEIGAWVLAE